MRLRFKRFFSRKKIHILLIATGFLIVAPSAFSQDFPSRPIKIIVPFAPGGAGDTVTRLLAQEMSKTLGQSVIVDNKPGADGIVGTKAALQAPPDGYNLLQVGRSTLVFNKGVYKNLPYDPEHDMRSIGLVLKTYMVLVTAPSAGFQSVKDLVVKAQEHRSAYNYAGTATVYDFALELFKQQAAIDVQKIPYKGSAPAIQDLVAGRVEMAMLDPMVAMPHIMSGQLKPLAVTSTTRMAILPKVPTMSESGYPDFEMYAWTGIAAPSKISPSIIKKLNASLNMAVNSPEVSTRIKSYGFEPVTSSPEQMQKLISDELKIWPAKLKEFGFTTK